MSRPWTLPLVGFALALALALRFVGIGYFLPHQSDPDAHAINQMEYLQNANPHVAFSWGKYGQLIPRALMLLPGARLDAPPASDSASARLEAAGRNHLRARWVSAVLGALVVPGTFWLARYWFGGGWSLVAACFAGTSLLHLSFSQQARPHVPFATLALVAVLAAMRMRRQPSGKNVAFLSAALFLAAGTLHSAAFLLPSCAVALWFARARGARFTLGAAVSGLAAVLVSLALFWPFLFGDPGTFEVGDRVATHRFPHLVETRMFDGSGFVVLFEALEGYDPVLLWTAAAGALFALVRLARWRRYSIDARHDVLVALGFALPCGLTFGLFGNSFERFFLPLYPFLGLLAALALHDLTWAVGRLAPRARPVVGVVVSVLALALPTYASARLVMLRAQPDTFELAARFLAEADPSLGARTLLHPRAVLPIPGRLDTAARDLPHHSAWLHYLATHPESAGASSEPTIVPFPQELSRHAIGRTPKDVRALGQVALDLESTAVLSIVSPVPALRSALTRWLEQNGECVWEVEHRRGDLYADDGYQERKMLKIVLSARVWGPRLGLYRPGAKSE